MRQKLTALLFLCMAAFSLHAQEKYYTKEVIFPDGATPGQKLDMAARLVPTENQKRWQEMELTAFLHFGMNTFTGNEWGSGKEDPALFDPTQLDCEQWVKALKDAGFKMAILTAKHHDGFCLWPTKTTSHSVASSPWKDGKGDVVKELRDACTKYGIRFGVYLSPWDRNAECYGNSPEYNRFFIEQLTELLSNYGKVDEVWFDGACGEGPNGKKQEYDWKSILSTIHRLQPDAVTAIMGDDVRWVGNERGLGRVTEWSATALTPGSLPDADASNRNLGIEGTSKDLGSRDLVYRAKKMYWYPSEVDVSIRPGWFYHKSQDGEVKSLAKLTDIYFKSVGYNSVLLLNIPPDRRGLIHENDVKRLKEFADYRQKMFSRNYLKREFRGADLREGTSLVLKADGRHLVNTLLLGEDISRGQRVEKFAVDATSDGKNWTRIAYGTTIGYKRLIRFAERKLTKLRITLLSSRGTAHIAKAGLFFGEKLSDEGTSGRKLLDSSAWKPAEGSPFGPEAFDGNAATSARAEGMRELVLDLGGEQHISGFCYTPDEANMKGTIFKYAFYVSSNGKDWQKCQVPGEFGNIQYNPLPYYVELKTPVKARFVKLVPLAVVNDENYTAIGDFGLF